MAYLVQGKSVSNYWDVKFGRSEPTPFLYVLEDAESDHAAVEFVRNEIAQTRGEVALVSSVEKIDIWSDVVDPLELDYDAPWYSNDLVAFDVETTGLSSVDDRIIEIGFSRYNPTKKCFDDPQSFFVNDGVPVSEETTKLTGITQAMIEDAPSFEDLVPSFYEYLGPSTILICHNRTFDVGFFLNSMRRCSKQFRFPPSVCSMELSLRTELNQKNNRLETIAEILGVDGVNSHRAGDDAKLAGNTFLALARRHKYFHKATTRQFLDYFDKATWA